MIRFSNRVVRLAWLLVSLVLVLLALGSVAGAVRTLLADVQSTTEPPVPPPVPALPTQLDRATFAALSTSPVFGALSADPGPRPVRAAVVPDLDRLAATKLKLRLVGAVTTGPGLGFAIIENKTARTQKLYDIGDTIIEGAVLQAVYEQRVVLLRNGQQELLAMLQDAVPGAPGSSRSRVRPVLTSRRGPVRSAGRAGRDGAGGERSAIRRINDNLRVINAEQFQREMGPDLLPTLDSVYTEPRMVGGQPSGLVLRDLGQGQLLASLGFQAGDVVVSLNGKRVNSQQDLLALNTTLQSANDIRVQIIRNNLPRHLIFKVR